MHAWELSHAQKKTVLSFSRSDKLPNPALLHKLPFSAFVASTYPEAYLAVMEHLIWCLVSRKEISIQSNQRGPPDPQICRMRSAWTFAEEDAIKFNTEKVTFLCGCSRPLKHRVGFSSLIFPRIGEPPHTSCLDPDSKRPKRSFISNIAFKLRD